MIFDCSATTCLQYTNIRNNLKVKVNKPAQRNHNMEEHTNFLVHYDDTQKLFFIEKNMFYIFKSKCITTVKIMVHLN